MATLDVSPVWQAFQDEIDKCNAEEKAFEKIRLDKLAKLAKQAELQKITNSKARSALMLMMGITPLPSIKE